MSRLKSVSYTHLIATLAEGAKLNMELVLQKGQGYVSADRNKQLNLSLIHISCRDVFPSADLRTSLRPSTPA